MADVLKTLSVNFEYLVASLEANFLGLRALLYFRHENAKATLETTQDGKVEDLVTRRPC
jgi:hypothetical protein